jgi:zinc protease
MARVKRAEDAVAVRDRLLGALQAARLEPVPTSELEAARSHNRYAFLASLDSTESIASTLATFVRHDRSYETVERYYALYDQLTPEDVQQAARRYVTDARLVVTTLAHDELDPRIAKTPPLADFSPVPPPRDVEFLTQEADLPQVVVKLLFEVGSAHDPEGREGLAALAAAMVSDAGSRGRRIDEIREALHPIAGRFDAQVDKEMTVLTAAVHRDRWDELAEVALPMLLEPGLREEDFSRLKDRQRSALEQDLRSNNEEELGKERLQNLIFAGTPYGHTALGTLAGIDAITLEDVRRFVRERYTRANLVVGVSGRPPEGARERLVAMLASLPEGPAAPEPAVRGRAPRGLEVEIVEKQTRATAISFGHPIEVTRAHPDFAALWLARTWLGEHRSSVSHLYRRIREERGMNYGDYAYIEAFPRGMFQFFPDANIARRAQLFEVWIRPVPPESARMALRIALHELQRLVEDGLDQQQFESTREYVMKSVFLLTARQEERLGYALDSRWHGIGEFTSWLRGRVGALTREEVNAAIRRHLSWQDLQVVFVSDDAQALRDELLADTPSRLDYDAEKPAELLEEDAVIGARKLGLDPERVRITPVEEVFAR